MGLLVICLRKLRVSLLAGWEKQVSCPQTPLPSWWGRFGEPGAEETSWSDLAICGPPHWCPCSGPAVHAQHPGECPSPQPAPLRSLSSHTSSLQPPLSISSRPGKCLWIQNKTCGQFPDRQSLQSKSMSWSSLEKTRVLGRGGVVMQLNGWSKQMGFEPQ